MRKIDGGRETHASKRQPSPPRAAVPSLEFVIINKERKKIKEKRKRKTDTMTAGRPLRRIIRMGWTRLGRITKFI